MYRRILPILTGTVLCGRDKVHTRARVHACVGALPVCVMRVNSVRVT